MTTQPSWYTIHNIDSIDTPALVVYPERVKENIRLMISMSKGVAWLRPHVKTHKMAEVTRLLMDQGITKFKCATIAEAEMLAMEGAEDILLAYQPVGPKINRLLQLVAHYPNTRFACLIDNLTTAQAIAHIFEQASKTIHVYIDLNVGMNRTGIVPGKEALDLYRACREMPGIIPVGLHAYDGHLRDTDLTVRKEKCDTAFRAVTDLAQQIADSGETYPVLVAGGSPTFPIHVQRENVECSPGTFIFWDDGYHSMLAEQEFLFAALIITRVISRIDAHTLCLDLGHKAVAAENPLPRVKFLNAPDAIPVSQSEEHMVVQVPDGSMYQIGDVFYGVPIHICPTCALYQHAEIIENNSATKTWKVIARNRYIQV